MQKRSASRSGPGFRLGWRVGKFELGGDVRCGGRDETRRDETQQGRTEARDVKAGPIDYRLSSFLAVVIKYQARYRGTEVSIKVSR